MEIEKSEHPAFNRLKLTSNIVRVVTVCKDGINASFYNVEEVFNSCKELCNLKISSLILLKRIINAVRNKELEPFNLVVVDLDGKEYSGSVDENGAIIEIYHGSIMYSKIMSAFMDNNGFNGFFYKYPSDYIPEDNLENMPFDFEKWKVPPHKPIETRYKPTIADLI